MKRERREASCLRYKKKAFQATAVTVSRDFDETTSWMRKMRKISCLHVYLVHASSLRQQDEDQQQFHGVQ